MIRKYDRDPGGICLGSQRDCQSQPGLSGKKPQTRDSGCTIPGKIARLTISQSGIPVVANREKIDPGFSDLDSKKKRYAKPKCHRQVTSVTETDGLTANGKTVYPSNL